MSVIERDEINQYLTFKLGDELYGISVAHVKEVLELPVVTKVPRMPPFLCGVCNLRGNIIPLLDLKLKFGIGKTVCGENTSVIVVELGFFNEDEEENLIIGIYSDGVQNVITLEADKIKPPPKIGVMINTEFILGMGRVDDEFVILLNIEKILSESELASEKIQG